MIRSALVLVALAGAARAQPTKPSPAAALLTAVEANYKAPRHLKVTFEQTVTNAVSGQVQEAPGVFYVEKPDKLRFDFFQPKRKDPKLKSQYFLDGKTLWVLDHKNTQYAKQSAANSELPATVAFFLGAGSLARDFNVATTTASLPAGTTGLELTPKKPSATYAKIVLAVDAKRMVTQVVIVNSSGNTQTMKFSAVEIDKPAPKNWFVVDAKAIAGYRVIKP